MKRLTKGQDKVICGVCSGFAAYFGVDANLIRIGMAAFTLLGGSGLLLYIVAAILMPDC